MFSHLMSCRLFLQTSIAFVNLSFQLNDLMGKHRITDLFAKYKLCIYPRYPLILNRQNDRRSAHVTKYETIYSIYMIPRQEHSQQIPFSIHPLDTENIKEKIG